MKHKVFIKQYPHGLNTGFEYHDGKCPPMTTSSWEHNNFLVFYEEKEIVKFKDKDQLEIDFGTENNSSR